MAEPITIRPFVAGDADGFVACYNSVFPTPDGAVPRIDRAVFDWKYARNPLGRYHITVAEHRDEGIVGAYPSQLLRVWMDGREELAAQITDLMVAPRHRRHGPRPGLFVALGRAFYDTFCGTGPGRQVFNFGWPVPAWRMGQRYLDYQNIRDWNVLFREFTRPGQLEQAPGDLEVVPVQEFGADVDALFDTLKHGTGLTLVRDRSYLNWRYSGTPRGDYRLFECRERGGALRAVFVFAASDFLRPRTGYVVDWLVPADDRDALTAIVCAAERCAAAAGCSVVAGVWSPVDPRFRELQRLGFWLFDTRYFIVVASFRDDTAFFRDQWSFTMGDSDLI